jgi:hypothetical protein
MPSKAPKVVVVVPKPMHRQVRDLIRGFTDEARKRDLRLSSFETREIREVSEEHWTKPVRLLAPDDAAAIYRLLHHGPTMVVAFASAFVRRDPSSRPLTRKQAIPLSRFVAHKAHSALINGRTQISPALDAFETWRSTVRCDGQDDPRVLPLQSFSTSSQPTDLGLREAREWFDREHGSGASRTDSGGRRWERASVCHGREALTVAGFALPVGMHWDVQFSAAKATFHCTAEVWHVPRGCHLNVYPDGHARGRPGKAYAKRVWPKKRP